MSISASLANAISGLGAASLRTQVASSNIANAQTEGYGRRVAELAPRALGGVEVTGVRRDVDVILQADRRVAEAGLGEASVRSDAMARIERAIGSPDEAGSLSELVTRLEVALIDAESRPDEEVRLDIVQRSAGALAAGLNDIADAVQQERARADAGISRAVETLNASLLQVEDLNTKIARAQQGGLGTAPLIDQRQAAIDRISEIVPVREVARDNGRVALFTVGGAILFDGSARTVGFTPATTVTAYQSFGAGTLSGLTLGGDPIPVDGKLGGGRLAGLFSVRDEIAPEVQAAVDGFARDLVERFADPTVDTTRAPVDPGLFTDGGATFDPADEIGLAARIALNPLVDPQAGGAVWRIRDGLGTATPGDIGDARLITRLSAALTTADLPSSASLSPVARSSSGLAAGILSDVGVTRQFTDQRQAQAAAQAEATRALELQRGVDTDQELQDLLLIEQAYAANARVIQTVDALITRLLEI